MPLISVLLPVRNAATWLDASLASLARQTLADFEIIAVDDGSTDESGAMLDRFAARESRLRVVHTSALGLPLALNTALSLARAPLLARHDADDLSHRRRFELQHAYMESHPEAAVVGSRVRLFPSEAVGAGMSRWIIWHNRLLTHEAMAREALIDSPLTHGTALIRRAWLERVGGWAERGWPEDLDLWLRLLAAGARLAKLPQTLYGWRQHAASATRRDPRYSVERFLALKCEALALGLLRGERHVHLAGTGDSLRRWQRSLAAAGFEVTVHAARHPAPPLVAPLARPLVLAYTAARARERWRAALGESDMRELDDFIFVA